MQDELNLSGIVESLPRAPRARRPAAPPAPRPRRDDINLDGLIEPVGQVGHRASASSSHPHGAFDALTDGDWSPERAEGVKSWYKQTYGRELPHRFGQTATHNRMGLDHSQNMDVALNPTTEEGKAFISHLRENRIPFLAYDRAVPGASTAPHIHVGHPSRGGVPDDLNLESIIEPLDDDPPEVVDVRAPKPEPEFGQLNAAARRQGRFTGAAFRVPLSADDTQETARRKALESVARLAGLTDSQRAEFVSRTLPGYTDSPLASDEEFERYRSSARGIPVEFSETASPELVDLLRSYQSSREVGDARFRSGLGDDEHFNPARTAGERFMDVAEPLVDAGLAVGGKAARVADLTVGRPLAALSAGFWSRARRGEALTAPDPYSNVAGALALLGEDIPADARNPVEEKAGELAAPYGPRVQSIARFVGAQVDPSNLIPLAGGKAAGRLISRLAQGEGGAARVAQALRDLSLYSPEEMGFAHKAADDPRLFGELRGMAETRLSDVPDVPVSSPSSARVRKGPAPSASPLPESFHAPDADLDVVMEAAGGRRLLYNTRTGEAVDLSTGEVVDTQARTYAGRAVADLVENAPRTMERLPQMIEATEANAAGLRAQGFIEEAAKFEADVAEMRALLRDAEAHRARVAADDLNLNGLIEETPTADDSAIRNPQSATPNVRPSTFNAAPAFVPETPETLAAQMDALKAGRRAVVEVTPDLYRNVDEKVVVPGPMRSFRTPDGGRIIYDPKLVSREEVIRRMDDGTLGELMGHVETQAAGGNGATGIVVAKDAEGREIQSSYVSSPETAAAQAEAFSAQHPGARIEAGGPELEQSVLDARGAAPRARLKLERPGEVYRFRGRDVAVVTLPDGTAQPFYRSSGRNSKQPGRWFPFDGVKRVPDGLWFDKERFVSGGMEDASHPLHRFGSDEMRAVSDELARLDLPAGRAVAEPAELNRLLKSSMSDAHRGEHRAVPPPGGASPPSGGGPVPPTTGDSAPRNPPPDLQPSLARRAARGAANVLQLPKALKASFDWSGPGRQGLAQVLAHPSFLKKTLRDQARATVSQAEFDDFARSITEHPDYELMREAGLHLSSPGGRSEEAFASEWSKKIPGVKQSDRAYSAALDSLRVQAWDLYASEIRADPRTTKRTWKAAAELINISTGRGVVPVLDRFDLGKKIVNILNVPFFSPRNTAAKFNLISPRRIVANALKAETRVVGKTQMRDALRGTATLAATLGLLGMVPGVEVGLNPWGKDFGKVKVGQTHYDLLGGESATIKYLARLTQAFYAMEQGAEVEESKRPLALTRRYLRSQLGPSAAVAVDYRTGETFAGKEFTYTGAAVDLAMPFIVADAYEGWTVGGGSSVSDVIEGKPLKTGFVGAAKTLPSFVGVGVGSYAEGGQREPSIAPTLSAPVARELERLKINLKHLGPKGKRSAEAKPGYAMEGLGGDTMRPLAKNSETLVKLEGGAERVAAELSEEINAAVGEVIASPDYESFTYDYERKAYLEQVIVAAQARVMNGTRLKARETQIEQLDDLKEYQRRLEGRTPAKGKHFKL